MSFLAAVFGLKPCFSRPTLKECSKIRGCGVLGVGFRVFLQEIWSKGGKIVTKWVKMWCFACILPYIYPASHPQISPVGLHFPDYLRQFRSIRGTLPIFGLFCHIIQYILINKNKKS